MNERTLVVGFGPYLNVADNPSAHIAEALDLPHVVLEVSYTAAEKFVFQRDPSYFDCLLLLGAAPSRKFICPELFARNVYGGVADVEGNQRTGEIEAGQPLLLSSTMFTDEPMAAVLADDPHMRLSLDAGCYLCNFLYYEALTRFPGKQVGFVHLPLFDAIPMATQIQSIYGLMRTIETDSPTAESYPRRATA
ncbi:MAG TPA: hypothetical protein VHE55_06615 [Fimbriimonadaceae bacterium]|nr:hypothetical protein [Fimbriimonadaceae bacterium]